MSDKLAAAYVSDNASISHKEESYHTESKNYDGIFSDLEDKLKSVNSDIICYYGKKEMTINVLGETWKADFIATYKDVLIFGAEAWTSVVGPGKKKVKGQEMKENIEDHDPKVSLHKPGAKQHLKTKTFNIFSLNELVDDLGENCISPISLVHHGITTPIFNKSRNNEIKTHYTNEYNQESYKRMGVDYFNATLYNTSKIEKPFHVAGISTSDFMEQIKKDVKNLIDSFNDNSFGIPIPLGNHGMNENQVKKFIKKQKDIIKEYLDENLLSGAGSVTHAEMKAWEYAAKHPEIVFGKVKS